MMTEHKFSRRKFVQSIFKFSYAIMGFKFISGCGREEELSGRRGQEEDQIGFGDSCDDLSNVSQSEIDKREVYGYIEETPYPDNRCDNCSLYIPSIDDEYCGGCILFEGPVFPAGYCEHWAPET